MYAFIIKQFSLSYSYIQGMRNTSLPEAHRGQARLITANSLKVLLHITVTADSLKISWPMQMLDRMPENESVETYVTHLES